MSWRENQKEIRKGNKRSYRRKSSLIRELSKRLISFVGSEIGDLIIHVCGIIYGIQEEKFVKLNKDYMMR